MGDTPSTSIAVSSLRKKGNERRFVEREVLLNWFLPYARGFLWEILMRIIYIVLGLIY